MLVTTCFWSDTTVRWSYSFVDFREQSIAMMYRVCIATYGDTADRQDEYILDGFIRLFGKTRVQ